jgi:hypothetical protein
VEALGATCAAAIGCAGINLQTLGASPGAQGPVETLQKRKEAVDAERQSSLAVLRECSFSHPRLVPMMLGTGMDAS